MLLELALKIRGLTVAKDGIVLVDDINLEFSPGNVVAVLGATGSGKSTLIRAIAGLDIVKKGHIVLGPQDITKLPPYKRFGIASVLQRPGVFPNTTPYQNVEIVLNSRRQPPQTTEPEILRILDVVELTSMSSLKVDFFSGGETARVAIARGLAVDPVFLIVDEALSAIDAPLRRRILSKLKLWSVTEKRGLIFVTHDQLDAFMFADELVLLEKGKVVANGPPKEVYSLPSSRSVGEFLGIATTFNAVVTELNSAQDTAVANLLELGVSVNIRLPTPINVNQVQQVTVIVRPEDIIVSPIGVDLIDHEIEGYIVESIFTGGASFLRIETVRGRKNLIARDPSDYPFDRFKRGEKVTFMLRGGLAAVCQ